jgi:hypothetical protein
VLLGVAGHPGLAEPARPGDGHALHAG